MGVFSGLEGTWGDFLHTTYNEKKRKSYDKLGTSLDRKLEKLKTEITNCDLQYNGFSWLYEEDNELQGSIIDTYLTFAENSDKLMKNEINVADTLYNKLSEIREEVRTLYINYNQKCIEEDEAGRELSNG